MILIADGGTTKCDWVGCNKGETDVIMSFSIQGINPSYLSENELRNELSNCEELESVKTKVEEVYFFGSGCGAGVYQRKLTDIFKSYFSNAHIIKILSDIHGAAYACTEREGVVGILGTGSNICYFDGRDVEFWIPSLGYILMDQGSGNAIGKKLLRSYFFKKMPDRFLSQFEQEFNLDLDHVKIRLYDAPAPSSFLASFAVFLFKHLPDAYMEEILVTTLNEFFDLSVAIYQEKLVAVPLHFVGSIAYYSKDYIEKICYDRGYKLGNIVKNPILNLPERVMTMRLNSRD